jgi:hypothetical protein
MKEQSHKDEMSAALRGDFQRLRERGVAVALAPQEPDSDPEAPPEPEEPAQLEPTEHDEPQGSAPAAEPVIEPEPASERRGWLSRLAGR